MFIDHEAEAEIEDVLGLGPAVDRAAVIEIAGALIAVVVAALVPIARVLAANHTLAASLKTGKKIAVPNQGKNNPILPPISNHQVFKHSLVEFI